MRSRRPAPPTAEEKRRHPELLETHSKVRSTTVASLRIVFRPQMRTCVAEAASGADEGARASVILTISVADEILRVDAIKVKSIGLTAAAEESLLDCATEAMVGYEQEVAGSEDVAAHVLTFPYSI